MIALLAAMPAGASETCDTNTPRSNVRRTLEKQAAKLVAPEAVDAKSLWFCGYGGLNAEAVVRSIPRRLPDGSDLVRQVWCQRYDEDRPARWNCHPSEHRQTDTMVTIEGTPWRFTVVLTPDGDPESARWVIDQALRLSSGVAAQNRCGSYLGEHDLERFTRHFATKPSTDEDPTFTLYHSADLWQVTRNLTSLTLAIPEGSPPELRCWAAAQGEL